MGAGFRKDSPKLREAFNDYLEQTRRDGTYSRMVQKYYPTVFTCFEDFFTANNP
ncbi:transporter substrate-binding domain-containing protein [Allochromatium vinosum]|nr:transporter substrate-binding domain-containing protein [Allochromatium vinosum]